MLLDATAANPAAAAAVSLLVLVAIAVGIGLYFLPTIIAVLRHNANALMIGVLNFFLGWTFLGWVVSLALAFSANQQAPVVNVYQSNGAPAPTLTQPLPVRQD
jgi:hypothetical protein